MQPTPALSPTLYLVTALPTAATRPTISWPGTRGQTVDPKSLLIAWILARPFLTRRGQGRSRGRLRQGGVDIDPDVVVCLYVDEDKLVRIYANLHSGVLRDFKNGWRSVKPASSQNGVTLNRAEFGRCQSARNVDPLSASNLHPPVDDQRLACPALAGVAEGRPSAGDGYLRL